MIENEIYRSLVKEMSTGHLEAEAKSMAFICRKMQRYMPFPCPYLEEINEELKKRYFVEGF